MDPWKAMDPQLRTDLSLALNGAVQKTHRREENKKDQEFAKAWQEDFACRHTAEECEARLAAKKVKNQKKKEKKERRAKEEKLEPSSTPGPNNQVNVCKKEAVKVRKAKIREQLESDRGRS